MLTVCRLLPGGGKQALDGGDEDEHDEGAHQVGLEHLVPHLGVLHSEREKKRREKRGRGGEGGDGETSFQTDGEAWTPANTPTHRHGRMQWFNHKR